MSALKILQINCHDFYGGAETVMQAMHHAFIKVGHDSRILVGQQHNKNQPCEVFDHDSKRSVWTKFWIERSKDLLRHYRLIHGSENARKLGRFLTHQVGQPFRTLRKSFGHEDFDFPDTASAVERMAYEPDLIQIHGLHGNYFDLRDLASLSQKSPIFVTLHDTWLFTGHCAYTGSCTRYKVGCGQCPDLKKFPKISRDATRYNMERKFEIYSNSNLSVATPSKWMMSLFENSIVGETAKSKRVIYNGIDLERFSPKAKDEARCHLGLDLDEYVMLYVARNAITSPYKDYGTIEEAVMLAAQELAPRKVRLIVLGDEAPEKVWRNLTIQFSIQAGYGEKILWHYAAADLLLHAARAENLPTVILEAQAMGRPVIGTETGGIPEEILNLDFGFELRESHPVYDRSKATGCIVRKGDSRTMSKAIVRFLEEKNLLDELGGNARQWVVRQFDEAKMADAYLEWYQEGVDRNSEQLKGKARLFKRRREGLSVYVDVTSSCKSPVNTGVHRMTRGVYNSIRSHFSPFPLVYERIVQSYCRLTGAEKVRLRNPFGGRRQSIESPESLANLYFWSRTWRVWSRPFRKYDLTNAKGKEGVLIVPETYTDQRIDLFKSDVCQKAGLKTIAIFHDAIPVTSPELIPPENRKGFDQYMESLAHFDCVVCVSRESEEDLKRFWKDRGILPARTVVISWPMPFEKRRPSIRANFEAKTVLFVSSLEPRKNHDTLLAACEKLWCEGVSFKLVLVGKVWGAASDEIIAKIKNLEDRKRRIEWRKHVDDQTLFDIYQECSFSVYPSLAEGFGLPILESLWHNRPCVCGFSGSIGEVAAGGGCLQVDQSDVNSLAEGIRRLLSSRREYDRLIEEARSRKFKNWKDYFEEFSRLF